MSATEEQQVQQLQQQLEKEAQGYKELQAELGKYQSSYQQYSQQKSENDMVLSELNALDEAANVYKQVGPALMKQDLVEAKTNVSKRLEYINSEMSRLASHMQSIERKQSSKQSEIMKLQNRLQSIAQKAQQKQSQQPVAQQQPAA